MLSRPKLQFLYTNIGRGHPSYLDGLAEALARSSDNGLVRVSTDVFAESQFTPRMVWHLARLAYTKGSSNGLLGKLYNRARRTSNYNRPSYLIRLAGRDIIKNFVENESDLLIVAHPILVGLLAGRERLIYQHGELVAPDESLVKGAGYILVPTERVARRFIELGYRPDRVIVTGLCIEPALVEQAAVAMELRQRRLGQAGSLTGMLFSSGAEPEEHIHRLALAARSIVEAGHRVIVSVAKEGRFERVMAQVTESMEVQSVWINSPTTLPSELPSLTVIASGSRREENVLVARLFPLFDFFVAPAHERTNWAIGLGLPIFALHPCYGSYAPLNLKYLLSQGVACQIQSDHDARSLGEKVTRLKADQSLTKMSQAGWGREPIDGFEQITKWLDSSYPAK